MGKTLRRDTHNFDDDFDFEPEDHLEEMRRRDHDSRQMRKMKTVIHDIAGFDVEKHEESHGVTTFTIRRKG